MKIDDDGTARQRGEAAASGEAPALDGIPDELKGLPYWVCWRQVVREAGKPPAKVPFRPDGGTASASSPATWSTYEACEAAFLDPRRGFAGLGIVLGTLNDGAALVGCDLDACGDRTTGHVEPWAGRILAGLRSYAEWSPSGRGIKVFGLCDPAPVLTRHKRVIRRTGQGHPPAVELYVAGRFFTLTGWQVAGQPDTLEDVGEPVQRLAWWVARGATDTLRGRNTDAPPVALPDGDDLPVGVQDLLHGDADLAALWRGEKATGDTSRSGLDASLAVRLAPHLDDDALALALKLYPHGQLADLEPGAAERRLGRLLALADAERVRIMERAKLAGRALDDRDLAAVRLAFRRSKVARAIWTGERAYPDPRRRRFAFCAALARAGVRDGDALAGAVLALEERAGRDCPLALAALAVAGALRAEGRA